jgi:glycosyltransferase involved in cell wall biosynthesis
MTNRLVILTNVPTPYRIPFFNALNAALGRNGADLCVLFCAVTEPNRKWAVDLADQQYQWKILPGVHPNLKTFYPHFNPTVLGEFRRLHPTWLLVAGAWNTPTMLLAHLRWVSPAAPRIQWSEGHADAVLHPTGPIARLRRQVLRSYDGFAVPNSRSADYIRAEVNAAANSGPPILRLPNTVDDQLFTAKSRSSREAARTRYGLPQDQLVVTTVAQLEERKGIRELIEAFCSLSASEQQQMTLAIVGEGSLKQKLRHLAGDHLSGQIRLLGHLEQAEVRDVLAASDVFLLPTKQDPNPLSVIEAAFVGLPLVVTKQAGNVYDLITDGNNGIILEAATPTNIAAALRVLLQCAPSTLHNMGQVSKAVAQQNFQRNTVASTFADDLMTSFPPGRWSRKTGSMRLGKKEPL